MYKLAPSEFIVVCNTFQCHDTSMCIFVYNVHLTSECMDVFILTIINYLTLGVVNRDVFCSSVDFMLNWPTAFEGLKTSGLICPPPPPV